MTAQSGQIGRPGGLLPSGQAPGEPGRVVTTADLIDRLVQFQGEPREFLVNLLAVQCRLSAASAASILRTAGERFEPVAIFPPLAAGQTAPTWLAQAVESAGQVAATGKTAVASLHAPEDMYGQPARRQLVLIPLRGSAGLRGLAAYVVERSAPPEVAAAIERLEMTVSLLSLYEMRLTLQQRQSDLRRLRAAMELSAAVGRLDRFMASAMAMCNEVASRWQCERVSLGFLKGRYVRLKATSSTEKFSRRMKLVQDIEAAMEECLDQDVEVAYPAGGEDIVVSRAAEALSRRHGPTAVVSFPLRVEGEPAAVVTVERHPDTPLAGGEIDALRLACDLCTPHLTGLQKHDRWIGARAAGSVRKVAGAIVGARHTWAKLGVLAAIGFVVFTVLKTGPYRAEAPFVVEATQRQVVPAPWDGRITAVHVEPPDRVIAGETLMAELDDSELRLKLAAEGAERITYLKTESAAMRDGKTSDAQIARAEVERIDARIALLGYQIAKARIVAPMTGTVVAGELKRRIGSPVQTGEVLFEVAPLETLRAELYFPEDQIAEVHPGRTGELATAGAPERRIPFVVERINPMAEQVDGQNVFKVKATFVERPEGMRPGMEGLAKVDLGRRRLAWLWSRKLVDWLRMKLWI